MDLPILGGDNVYPVTAVVCDMETHLFKIWDDKYVSNTLLFNPTFNGTKLYLIVSGCDTCVSVYKHQYVTFPNVLEEIFIVHMVVHGLVA